jgi:hypothetical protein
MGVVVCFEHLLNLYGARLRYERDLTVTWRTHGQMKTNPKSVATILDREIESAIKEWLRRVSLLPELTQIPLSDEDRSRHLPQLFHDLACRLRLAKDIRLLASSAATAHGQRRRLQGYSLAMLVEESRLFQVVTFQTLHLHRGELDQDQLLSAVMVIADEADLQLGQAVRCWETPLAQA